MGIIYNAAIGPLSPYTEYICSVSLFNIAGWSPTKTAIKRTEPYCKCQSFIFHTKIKK